MNPPGTVEDLKKTTVCVKFQRQVLWILVYFTKTMKENMQC